MREARQRRSPTLSVESTDQIVLGYSAWPGWFPLAIIEEAAIFDEVGLDVEFRYFVDYRRASMRWRRASSMQ